MRLRLRRFVLAALAVVALGSFAACEPGGIGIAGTGVTPIGNPADDMAAKLRSCGLLTAGQTNFDTFGMSQGEQCYLDCYLGASCDDLEGLICGMYWPSGGLQACMEDCDGQEFVCADGSETMPLDWVCDGYEDCMDGSDEAGCANFTCADGSETMPLDWVCDGYEDCMDGSDEVGCPAPTEFTCADGSDTIPGSWVCDMEPDCMDGSDEAGCAEFICPNGYPSGGSGSGSSGSGSAGGSDWR